MARLEQKVDDQGRSLERIESALVSFIESADRRYVTQDAFRPIQRLVYAVGGAVIVAIVGAVMALIIIHH